MNDEDRYNIPAPQYPATDINSPDKTQTKKRISLKAALGFAVATLLVGAGVTVALLVQSSLIIKPQGAGNGAPSGPNSQSNTVNQPELTVFEKKLSASDLSSLRSIATQLYSPPHGFTKAPFLQHRQSTQWTNLNFSNGYSASTGLIPGTYVINTYTSTDSFNPPSNCGMAGGYSLQKSTVPCSLLPESTVENPAYIISGMGDPVIQNSKYPNTATVYVKRGATILSAVTVKSDAANAYKYLLTLQPIEPRNLPKDTYFSVADSQKK